MKLFTKLCLLSLLVVGIVACSTQAPTPTPTTTVVPTAEAAEVVPTTVAPTTEAPTTAAPEPFEVRIQLFIYRPEEIEVPLGTTVTWLNEDDIQHSVTSGTPENPTAEFDTGFFVKEESASITFDKPGTYQFFCMRHNHMQGVVVVTEG